MSGPKVSAVVNTLNAARQLEGCLQSLDGAVDEIVVVDMRSDDGTPDLARRYTPHVFPHPRMGYVEPARNFAVEKSTGEWVLVLDADERLTPALGAGLKGLAAEPGGVDVFLVPFNTRIAGRWMRGTGWGRRHERHPRFYRRGALTWNEEIHRAPTLHGRVANLPLPPEAAIDHHNYEDLTDFVTRLNRYTTFEAHALAAAGKRWSPEEMFAAARAELARRYEPGVDGSHSLVLAGLMAFYRYLAWAKLWEQEGHPQGLLPDTAESLLRWLGDPDEAAVGWAGPAALEAAMAHASEEALKVSPPAAILENPSSAPEPPEAPPSWGGAQLEAGFGRDEGGWRWMGREGRLRVKREELERDRILQLGFSGGPPGCYARAPFELRVYLGGGLVGALRVPGSDAPVRAELQLPRCDTDLSVRIVSGETFVPAERGMGEDRRELSVRLTGVELR